MIPDQDIQAMTARVESAENRTWAGGPLPVGPSISDGYRQAVQLGHDLAADLARLLEERETQHGALVQIAAELDQYGEWTPAAQRVLDEALSASPEEARDDA